ncbi:response regulator [Desulfobacter latus]|uniref:Response regulator n=1 Tax=Desulfobacter latus TaxID=2292 RepID=A0A850T0Q9_9BACT|nr:response regulator [Desulfobacter latus]NWH05283.1 response regulator [Desulfobacter latus]
MKILIVEDDPQIVTYIQRRLETWGYDHHAVSNGTEALQDILNTAFDIVLLDIMLPDYLGYDLIPELRQIDPDIDIITMTGESSRELEKRVRKAGVLYYMIKPIETHNLKLLLEHLCKQQ